MAPQCSACPVRGWPIKRRNAGPAFTTDKLLDNAPPCEWRVTDTSAWYMSTSSVVMPSSLSFRAVIRVRT